MISYNMRTVTVSRAILCLSIISFLLHPLLVIYSPKSLYSNFNDSSLLASLLVFTSTFSLLHGIWTYLLPHGYFFRYRMAPGRDSTHPSPELRISDDRIAEDYRYRDILSACTMTSGILFIDLLWLWFHGVRHTLSSLVTSVAEFDNAAVQFAALFAHGTVVLYLSLFGLGGFCAIAACTQNLFDIGKEAGVDTTFHFLRPETKGKED